MKQLSYHRKEKVQGLLFITPALLLFLVFMAYPMIYGLLLSFTSNRNAGSIIIAPGKS